MNLTMESVVAHLSFTAKVCGGLLAAYIGYVAVKIVLRMKRVRKLAREEGCKPAPTYRKLDPILGLDILYEFIQEVKTHRTLEGPRKRHEDIGNTLACRILGGKIMMTCEPENVKTILATKFEDWQIGAIRQELVPLIGRGIFTTDGPSWQHSRNLLKPMFTRSMIADITVFEMHVDRFLSLLPYDGTTVDLQPLFFRLTLDITSHVMLGESTDLQVTSAGTPAADFAAAFQGGLSYFGESGEIPIFGYFYPTKARKQFLKDCKFANAYVDKFIDKATDETQDPLFSPKSPGADPNRNILLYDLVSQEVPKDSIRSEVLNTILAGRDTTASLLSDMWFELSKHPKIFATLYEEVHELAPPDAELTFDLIRAMPYLRAILNETLRFHPVVPGNSRQASKDTVLPLGGGPDGKSPVFVPKGTLVAYMVYCMHRREDLWDDPDSFIPERWIDTDEKKGVRPGWAFLPFNGGPRICIGQQFALLLVSYVTVRVIQGMREGGLESRDPEDWAENVTLTCVGLNGCKVGLFGNEKEQL